MTGNCLKSSMVCQATVTTEDSRLSQTYVGLTENSGNLEAGHFLQAHKQVSPKEL